MGNRFTTVDIWAGHFPSETAADQYFEETYEVEDAPISPFAADMGQTFYDHDFMERVYFGEGVHEFVSLIKRFSFSASYHEAAGRAFAQQTVAGWNLLLLVWDREIREPVSVFKPGITLHYLGQFACDSNARPAD